MLQESFTGIQEEAVAAYRGNSARTNRMGIMLLAVLAVQGIRERKSER